jgi:uncharacterized protein YdeI (BOF family)
MRKRVLSAVLLVAAIGCAEKPPASISEKSDTSPLDAVVLAAKPEKATSVRDALKLKDGEKVVLTGRIPGEKVKPFNDAVAAVILMAPEDLDNEEIKEELDCDDAAT